MTETIVTCADVAPAAFAAARAEFPQFEWRAASANDAEALAAATIIFGKPDTTALLACHNLKWLQGNSAGLEKLVSVPAFLNGTFTLTTAAGMHAVCAEHAIALLLALTRRVAHYLKTLQPGGWKDKGWPAAPLVLKGRTVGVLGLGAIGRHICAILRAMDVRTLGVSRSGSPVAAADETFAINSLDDVLPRCDALISILPATRETDDILDARRLALLPRHAFLINVGRGNAVDEPALIAALRNGQLAGAGLDVFKTEPLPADSPFYALPNVVVSPHIGGERPDYNERAWDLFLENLRRYVQVQPLWNIVERERGY
jgi:phosphoglycerate dehydrogenase-like enzyme